MKTKTLRNILIAMEIALFSACAGGSGNADAVSPIEKDTTEVAEAVSPPKNDENEKENETMLERIDTDTTFVCKDDDEDALYIDSVLKSRGVIGKDEKAVYTKRVRKYDKITYFYDTIQVFRDKRLVYESISEGGDGDDAHNYITTYDFNQNKLSRYTFERGTMADFDSVSAETYKNGKLAQSFGLSNSEFDKYEQQNYMTTLCEFHNHERNTSFRIKYIADSVLIVQDSLTDGTSRKSLFSAKERDILKMLNGRIDSVGNEHKELDMRDFRVRK